MIVETTPTTAADIAEFFPRAAPWRIKALTVRIDGVIRGIGGYAVLPNGVKSAFIEIRPEDAQRYPVTLHKACRRFFAAIEREGVARLVAHADPERAAAPHWLERLGFVLIEHNPTESIYEWRRSSASSAA